MFNIVNDKTTLGLTPEGKIIIALVMDTGLFKDQIDAAKFAMTLAITSGFQPSQVERAETVWNVGSFDSDNHLRNLIPIIYPTCEAPYRAVEHLIDAGLKQIKSMIDTGNFDILTIIEQQEANPLKDYR